MTVDFPDYDLKKNYSSDNTKPKNQNIHSDTEDLLSPQCPCAF